LKFEIFEENMAQKFTASEQQLKPDAKYNSKLISRFINSMMHKGKKSVAQKAFYNAMNIVVEKLKDQEPVKIFETAVNNVKPMIEVRSKRVGGSSYQVPMQVSTKRQQSLAFRWIIQAARAKKGKSMSDRLASELIDAFNKQGAAMTTRENVHKMAEANKAFAHFAW
jgi:small subunit ribosomal protein S7